MVVKPPLAHQGKFLYNLFELGHPLHGFIFSWRSWWSEWWLQSSDDSPVCSVSRPPFHTDGLRPMGEIFIEINVYLSFLLTASLPCPYFLFARKHKLFVTFLPTINDNPSSVPFTTWHLLRLTYCVMRFFLSVFFIKETV
jgi:hypothetical protein